MTRLLHHTVYLITLVSAAAAAARSDTERRHLRFDGFDLRAKALGMAIVKSTRSLEFTYGNLTEALDADPGIQIVEEINHAAGESDDGSSLTVNPTRLIVFDHPST